MLSSTQHKNVIITILSAPGWYIALCLGGVAPFRNFWTAFEWYMCTSPNPTLLDGNMHTGYAGKGGGGTITVYTSIWHKMVQNG